MPPPAKLTRLFGPALLLLPAISGSGDESPCAEHTQPGVARIAPSTLEHLLYSAVLMVELAPRRSVCLITTAKTRMLAFALLLASSLLAAACATRRQFDSPFVVEEPRRLEAVFVVPKPDPSADHANDILLVYARGHTLSASLLDLAKAEGRWGNALLSPEGSRLLVQIPADGAFFTWNLLELDTLEMHLLSTPTNGTASWSPDGTRIAWQDLSRAEPSVVVADVITYDEILVLEQALYPAWSADARELTVVRYLPPDQVIAVISLEDLDANTLPLPSGSAPAHSACFLHAPVWSPQRTHLAFIHETTTHEPSAIFVFTPTEQTVPVFVQAIDVTSHTVHSLAWVSDDSFVWSDAKSVFMADMLAQTGWTTKTIAICNSAYTQINDLALSSSGRWLLWREVHGSDWQILFYNLLTGESAVLTQST